MFLNFHTHKSRNSDFEIYNLGEEEILGNKWFSAGVHPIHSRISVLNSENLLNKQCIAIGECGLDKLIDVPFKTQIQKFKEQILLSEEYQLPLIIHCVKSWNEIKALNQEFSPTQTWIYHGFRKTSILNSVLTSGVFIGIGSAILFDERLMRALKQIPTNRLLLETDDDKNVTIEDIYEKVAEIKNLSLPHLQNVILTNFKMVFTKWQIG
jgi:TatD DNase family protein